MTSEKPSPSFTKIGYIALRSNKHPLLFLLLLYIGSYGLFAQEDLAQPLTIEAKKDSVPPAATMIPTAVQDSVVTDSIQNDSLAGRKSILTDKIKYKAKDYVRINQKEQKIYLYNGSEIYCQDIELKAGIIIMDYIKNEVYAGRIKDSLGNYTQLPYFKQGDDVVIPDSIRFNRENEDFARGGISRKEGEPKTFPILMVPIKKWELGTSCRLSKRMEMPGDFEPL